MTACAYDNLATHTAEIHGFNSEGMHQSISDGIEVCRRTGKLACITCFREYACDVHKAADDLDMALHFSRLGLSSGQENSPNDRRCISALNAGNILHLTGELEQAEEMCLRALRALAAKPIIPPSGPNSRPKPCSNKSYGSWAAATSSKTIIVAKKAP